MRVVIHVSHFYNWEPVPADVEVSPEDIASRAVKPNKSGNGYDMRVVRAAKDVTGKDTTPTTIMVSEETVIRRIIHDHMPQNGGLMLTRKQAVANLIASNVMPQCAHPKHFKAIEVDGDDGPDEKLFAKIVKPYLTAKHASGMPLIDPDDYETLRVRYMAEADAKEHEDHLRTHFGVERAAKEAGQ